MSTDVLDILDSGRPQIEEAPAPPITNKRGPKPKPPKPAPIIRRKPEGMHRELFALLNTSDDTPLLPTDFAISSQNPYKQVRANLSIKRARKWRCKEFHNSARKDGLLLKHWERIDAPQQDYSFAKFNVRIDNHIPKYDDGEYNTLLICNEWTKEETDYLMQMCSRFDLRFIVIHDRYDRIRFKTERSVEDLKERYYMVHNQLAKHRAYRTMEAPKLKEYDSQHERKRKQQFLNLYNRTKEQIEEETNLLNELKKIEQKKKERERKMQDLQKIMDAGRSVQEHHRRNDSTSSSVGRPSGSGTRGMPGRRPGRGAGRPSRDSIASLSASSVPGSASSLLEANTVSIKFPDFRTSGTSLRSQRLKLPTSLGTKKLKALEDMLKECNLDLAPMPTETICQSFNELRGDLLLLYELRISLVNTEYEIKSITNQLNAVKPELVPADLVAATNVTASGDQSLAASTPDSSSRDISDVIDLNAVNTPGRKRKAALEQSNVLRKLKKIV